MNKISYIGFHGTKGKYSESILSKGFTSRINDKHWLGQGIYFYFDCSLAVVWAKNQCRNFEPTCVIHVEFEVDCSKLLNATTLKGFNYLAKEYLEFTKHGENSFKANFPDERILWSVLFTIFHGIILDT